MGLERCTKSVPRIQEMEASTLAKFFGNHTIRTLAANARPS